MGVIRGLETLPPRREPYEVLTEDVVETADVCVIGSGAGGAVVARELAARGRSVVLLERGGYYEGRDMNQRDMDMVPLLWKNAGLNFDDNMSIAIAQGACLGGSTVINDAVCFDPPMRVRAEWKELGVDFTEQEWTQHIARVNEMIHATPVSEEELNRNNRMLRAGAQKIGLRDHWSNRRNCINCMQCGFCHNGCHYETKQNMLVTYLHDALHQPSGEVRIYCNCAAETLRGPAGRIEGVEGSFLDLDGKERFRIRVNARVVVVCAGAIASSYLLLRNRIASRTAGRGVCLHPSVLIVGQFPYEIKPNQGIPMAYTIHDFGVNRRQETTRQEYGATAGEFLIESISLPMMEFASGMPGSPIEHHEFVMKFNQLAITGMLARDRNLGRVALARGGRMSFTYEMGAPERESLAKACEVAGKMWFALGATRIASRHPAVPFLDRVEDLPKLSDAIRHDAGRIKLASAHPQSGNPIGTDPHHSVVDPDCRVHGWQNLLVADASVFPSAVGVNPQVTVMVVASIAAGRMVRDWDRRYASLPVSRSTGRTGSPTRPMYFRREALAQAFDQAVHSSPLSAVLGPPEGPPSASTWSLDPSTLEITNDTRWRGFFARDLTEGSTVPALGKGFWKRFSGSGEALSSTTHPIGTELFAAGRASERTVPPFGKCLVVEYVDPPHSKFTEILKAVEDRVILGRTFDGPPSPTTVRSDFSLVRRYPFEFMTTEDHEMIFRQSAAPGDVAGLWEGQLVGDLAWSPPLLHYRYATEGSSLVNHYRLGTTVEGTAPVAITPRELDSRGSPGGFTDKVRAVNDEWMVGTLLAAPSDLGSWVPMGSEWLAANDPKSAVELRFVLHRIAAAEATTE